MKIAIIILVILYAIIILALLCLIGLIIEWSKPGENSKFERVLEVIASVVFCLVLTVFFISIMFGLFKLCMLLCGNAIG